jgi:hypothetical protein
MDTCPTNHLSSFFLSFLFFFSPFSLSFFPSFLFTFPHQSEYTPLSHASHFFSSLLLHSSPILLYFCSSPAHVPLSFFPFLFLSSLPLFSVAAAAFTIYFLFFPCHAHSAARLFSFPSLSSSSCLTCTHTYTAGCEREFLPRRCSPKEK